MKIITILLLGLIAGILLVGSGCNNIIDDSINKVISKAKTIIYGESTSVDDSKISLSAETMPLAMELVVKQDSLELNTLAIDYELIKSTTQFGDNLKLTHTVENTLGTSIINPIFYYVFDVGGMKEIEINHTRCIDQKCVYNELVDRIDTINFNDEIDFIYDDLTRTGFTLKEYYFDNDELWVGFEKNLDIKSTETIELDPTFSTSSIESMSSTVLNDTAFVLCYCDETADDVSYTIISTDGTVLVAETDLDTNVGDCLSHNVGCSAFNSSTWAATWFNNALDDILFQVLDEQGNSLISIITTDSAAGDSHGTSVSTFNSTAAVVFWNDRGSAIMTSYVYDNIGTIMAGPTTIGSSSASNCYTAAVDTLNSTAYVVSWFDGGSHVGGSDDVHSRVMAITGTALTAELTPDAAAGNEVYGVHVCALNSTDWAVVYDDKNDGFKPKIRTYNLGTALISETAISSSAVLGEPRGVFCTTLNETTYGILYGNGSSFYYTTSTNAGVIGPLTLISTENTATNNGAITAGKEERGNSFCADHLMTAWAQSATNASWNVFNYDGTGWDGTCAASGYSVNLTYPHEDFPASVSSYYNISVCFNVTGDGELITSGVTLDNITIDYPETTQLNCTLQHTTVAESCSGVADACDTHAGQADCETCGCTWTTGDTLSGTQIMYDGFESGWTFTGSSSNPGVLNCGTIGEFNGCDNDANDYQAGADSERKTEGTYSLCSEDWDSYVNDKGIWYTFNPSTACDGGECEDIFLTFQYTDTNSIESNEWSKIYGDDDSLDNQELWHCDGDDCPTSFALQTINLTETLDNSDTSWTITIAHQMSSTSDETHIDEWNITGYYFENACSGTEDACELGTCESECGCTYDAGGIMEQFAYNNSCWEANCTVPDFASGTKNIFVSVIYGGNYYNTIEIDAIDYGGGGGDTCTYSGSGDWEIDCTDNCVVSSEQKIDGDVNVYGSSGAFTLNAIITFISSNQYIRILEAGCEFIINSGGGSG